MSVSEARTIMPNMTSNMTDEEVINIIDKLENLAGALIEMVQFE